MMLSSSSSESLSRSQAARICLGPMAQALHFSQALQSAEHTTGIDWRKANGTKDHPVWASVPIATEPNNYDPN
jgi:hypothetical protein